MNAEPPSLAQRIAVSKTMRSDKDACLLIDRGCYSVERPYRWPQMPRGRMGSRWYVLDGSGQVVGKGDPGNARSAWSQARRTLLERQS